MMMMRTEKENVDDFEDVEENVGALLKMERYASSPKPDDDDAGGRMKMRVVKSRRIRILGIRRVLHLRCGFSRKATREGCFCVYF